MAGVKPLERAFAKTSLPLTLIEHPEQEILMSQMINLFENASYEVGDRLFGMRVGLAMDPSAYGKWTRYATEACHLEGAIQRLDRTVSLHQNMGRLLLETYGETAVWTYAHPSLKSGQGRNHADHILPTMLRIARRYLGPHWSPDWVRFFYDRDDSDASLTDMIGANVRYGGKGVSVALPRDQLHKITPQSIATPLVSSDVIAEAILKDKPGGIEEFKAIIALRLLEGDSDISGVAELTGHSVRSLQRQLHNTGHTYRSVLDQVRFRKARELLVETSTPVTQIAFLSGYSDPAHFTRSFKRWTGVTPSHFRP